MPTFESAGQQTLKDTLKFGRMRMLRKGRGRMRNDERTNELKEGLRNVKKD